MIRWILIGGAFAFWAVMTGLLVRTEMFPEADAAWRNVPPAHVLDVLFRQSEPSELVFFLKGEKMGSLTAYPKMLEDGLRQIAVRGDGLVRTPDKETHRIFFDTIVKMDEEYQVQHLSLTINLRKPELRLEILVNPDDKHFEYTLTEGENEVASDAGNIADLLSQGFPSGIVPGALGRNLAGGFRMPQATLQARLGTLSVQGEPIDVFRLIFRHAEGLESVVHISQVGRILGIETPFSFRLAAEGVELIP